jgi:hypothetical protein
VRIVETRGKGRWTSRVALTVMAKTLARLATLAPWTARLSPPEPSEGADSRPLNPRLSPPPTTNALPSAPSEVRENLDSSASAPAHERASAPTHERASAQTQERASEPAIERSQTLNYTEKWTTISNHWSILRQGCPRIQPLDNKDQLAWKFHPDKSQILELLAIVSDNSFLMGRVSGSQGYFRLKFSMIIHEAAALLDPARRYKKWFGWKTHPVGGPWTFRRRLQIALENAVDNGQSLEEYLPNNYVPWFERWQVPLALAVFRSLPAG